MTRPCALLLEEVSGFASHRPRSAARRNDPCPCGSGRKYKVCHLSTERHPLDLRAGWLYDKARRFLRVRGGAYLDELADEMAEQMDEAVEIGLPDSPLVADLALH